MPYSERSSIRPEAANYAVRGATLALRTTPRVSRAKAVLQVVYSVWSIVCVHIAALPAIFVARAGTRAFDIVMAPIVICTRANHSVSGMCGITSSFLLNDYEVYAYEKKIWICMEISMWYFFKYRVSFVCILLIFWINNIGYFVTGEKF